ncbi:MAG: hypothetical protein D6706_04940 [Chloroflexi bacterium]|nr:MAG: hypothetical protein D6706_04940 [Chloroflexota bacterium]
MRLKVEQTEASCPAKRNRIVTGIALIALGGLALVSQFVQLPGMGMLVLPGLSLIFIVWGIAVREAGLMIPGGILGGIGTGMYLMDVLPLEGTAEPGVFMLAFAGGFGLITLLTAVFTDETHWWALWPAGIMAFIGAGLLIGGVALNLLNLVGKLWPVALILFGILLVIRDQRGQ